MIVRLKVVLDDEKMHRVDTEFQFYDSPIKRSIVNIQQQVATHEFQFYDSPIKRRSSEICFTS